MKVGFYFRYAAVAAFAFLAGCSPEIKEEGGYLKVSSPIESALTVSGDGETVEIVVNSNLSWTISAADEAGAAVRWISFSESSGTGDATVSATVARNISADRTAVVTVMSRDRKSKAEFTVMQGVGSGSGDAEGYGFPAYDIIENVSNYDVLSGIANGVIGDNTFLFDNGAALTKLGTPSVPTFLWISNSYYQTAIRFDGWSTAEDAIVLSIPMKTGLCGDYRMCWGWQGSQEATWNVSYSTDGENWTDTGSSLTFAGSDRFKRDLFFTVDESNPVAPGGTLYLKLTPSAPLSDGATLTFNTGFLLTNAKPEPGNLPVGDKVLYTCDFSEVTSGCPYDLPVGYLRSYATTFEPDDCGYTGMTKTNTVNSGFGALRIGTASGTAGLTFPALEKIGDGTADLKVSFKAVLYQSADILSDTQGKASCRIAVSVAEGPGTIENGAIELANWTNFEERSVEVKGAGRETRIKIGIEGGSGDRRFYLDDVVIEATTDIVVPDVISKSLADVLSTGGTIGASWKTTATVTSDPAGGNCPENTVYVADGNTVAAIVTNSARNLKPGDKATFNLKGASVSGAVITLDASAEVTSEAGNAPAAKTVSISDLASSEYTLVEIKNVQAVDDCVGKTFSSDITMENAAKATFTLGVYGTAAFRGETVSGNSGSLKGIVVGGKLCPRNADDIALTEPRISDETKPVLFKPVIYIFDNTGSSTPAVKNASISGTVCTFDDGAAIEFVGSATASMAFAIGSSQFYNPYIDTKGWDVDGACFKVSVPVKEDISGNVALSFSVSKYTGKFEIFWSGDGETWTPTEYTWSASATTDEKASAAKNTFTGQSTIGAGITRTHFNVPAARKIPAGGKLYFKIAPQDNISSASQQVFFPFGFTIAPGDIENTPEPAGAVLFNNFSDCISGTDYMMGNIGSLANVTSCPAWAKTGWTVKSVNTRYGYVFCGTASGGDHGITTPALSALTGKTDVTLTFKCCLYMPASLVGAKDDICVKVADGDGTVGELVWDSPLDSDYYGWHTGTVTIKGASASTKLFIGAGAGKVTSGDRRMFLDDILVVK